MKNNIRGTRRIATAVYIVTAIAACLIYLRGIHGPYVLDDYPNLVTNPAVHLKDFNLQSLESAARSSPSGVFGRPLAMLTFAANYLASGNTTPGPVKLTNVVLHLVTGVGIFALSLLILPYLVPEGPDPPWKHGLIALLAAAFWLLHPLFVSTVLYAVQRMAILSALVLVYACVAYVLLRRRSLKINRGYLPMLAVATAGTLIATLCKENGALLPTYLLIIEWFCFRFRLQGAAPAWVRTLFKPLVIAPSLLILAYLVMRFRFAGNGALQFDLGIYRHLITEARALWNYVGWLLFLNPAPMGLVHRHFQESASLVSPITTLLSVAGWIAVGAAGVKYGADPRFRVYVFGTAWFLGGQLLESTTIPLSLMFEHRNYLPGFGVTLGLAALARHFVTGTGKRRLAGIAMLAYLFLLLPSWLLYQRVNQWHSEGSLAVSLLKVEPDSAWTWIQLAQFYNHRGDFIKALDAIRRAEHIEPREQSHVFNEAGLRCHFEPRIQLPGVLSRRIRMLDFNHPTSRAALWAFKSFAETCIKSPANRYFTLTLLIEIKKSKNGQFASIARSFFVNS